MGRSTVRTVRTVTLDPHSDLPLVRQLAAALRDRIAAGEWTPGGLLPAQARIAYEYGVGKATVKTAIEDLRLEGLITVERGIGIRVCEPVARRRVSVPRGATVVSRPATSEERREFGLRVGQHVQVVSLGVRVVGVHPADEVELSFR